MRTKSRLLLVTLCTILMAFSAVALAETHWNLQAVDSNGVKTWNSGQLPVTVTGVILNNPEEMLDSTANYLPYTPENSWNLGGQWQIFIEGIDPADHAGTACWMGQNYGNTWRKNSAFSYSDADWTAEMNRLNYDPDTGHHFRKGDLVQVYARNVGFYGGKTNINEAHNNDSEFDFDIILIQADYGLPTPDQLTLASLFVDPDAAGYDPNYPLFDSSRLSGGEYYQGCMVRINGLILTDSSGWGEEEWSNRICTVAGVDQADFKLRMPRGSIVDLDGPPTGLFDAIGILNQESGSGSDGRFGYELFVTQIIPEPTCLAVLVLGGLVLYRRRPW